MPRGVVSDASLWNYRNHYLYSLLLNAIRFYGRRGERGDETTINYWYHRSKISSRNQGSWMQHSGLTNIVLLFFFFFRYLLLRYFEEWMKSTRQVKLCFWYQNLAVERMREEECKLEMKLHLWRPGGQRCNSSFEGGGFAERAVNRSAYALPHTYITFMENVLEARCSPSVHVSLRLFIIARLFFVITRVLNTINWRWLNKIRKRHRRVLSVAKYSVRTLPRSRTETTLDGALCSRFAETKEFSSVYNIICTFALKYSTRIQVYIYVLLFTFTAICFIKTRSTRKWV